MENRKGTNSAFLNQARGFTSEPLVMSDLLTTPAAIQAKSQGRLLDDAMVLEILLRHLIKEEYRRGVIVDGFPRTPAQAEAIKLLRDKMFELRRQFSNSPMKARFPRSRFRLVVLYVSEQRSEERRV